MRSAVMCEVERVERIINKSTDEEYITGKDIMDKITKALDKRGLLIKDK